MWFSLCELLTSQLLIEAKNLMKDKFGLMIEYFVEDVGGYINDINSGFVEANYLKIKAAAHTIKSSSRQLGAVGLSELGRVMEELAKDENRGELEKKFAGIEQSFCGN